MNFLAHIHLSGGYPQLLVGNFIADFLRGRAQEGFPPGISHGIRLHRAIDAFTDGHPMVKQSVARLRPRYRRYALVMVDVFYDHFLAKNWTAFHAEPLPDFAQQSYRVLEAHEVWLPDKVKELLPYMVTQDWLSNYAGFYGIGQALAGLSRRASFENAMDEGVETLKAHYDAFDAEFMAFFPDMLAHVQPFWEEAKQLGQ